MAVVSTSGVEDGIVSNCEENEAPAEFIEHCSREAKLRLANLSFLHSCIK